jgi:hypothetical protein
MNTPEVYTIGGLARHFGVEAWQVRRLFQRNLLPPAARLGAWRVVTADDLPVVEQALRSAGYLARPRNEPAAPALA